GPQSPQDPFLARVFCHHQHVSGGPYGAIYSLYGNPADPSQAFTNTVLRSPAREQPIRDRSLGRAE
ncbi:MAG: hypothetical protein QOH91_4716, partial [Mycobacterium sp.]|nr:hypothetical protein [Mycobacterium sp.]